MKLQRWTEDDSLWASALVFLVCLAVVGILSIDDVEPRRPHGHTVLE